MNHCGWWAVEFLLAYKCIDTQQSKCGSGILEGMEGFVGFLIKQVTHQKEGPQWYSAHLWENCMSEAMIPFA